MTSKERVLKTINGERVDRIPVFMWYSAATTRNLAKHLKISDSEVETVLNNDIFQDWLSINKQMTTPCEDGKTFVDEWGITWKRDGEYNTAIVHPLADLDADGIAAYKFPDPDDPKRYQKLKDMIANNGANHFIGADVSGSLFEPAYHLRGMEKVLCDMMIEDKAADTLLDKLKDFTKRVTENALKMGADWIWLGDDFGTQQNMIASPDLWRKYFKPRLKEVIDNLKSIDADVLVAYHSCGAISPIIGDLCEIGINVLNPLQESAVGINHREIREKYPNLTMFCGLDTQQFLVNATSDEVYQKAFEKIKDLSEKGRYIFGCSHTIQHDVPVENILAMLKAAKHKDIKC